MSKDNRFLVNRMTYCGIFIALGIVISRFFALAPNEFTRFSIESVPIFLSGVLFGPTAGVMVGFSTDFIGCLFSPYGFNPLFCLPPMLYGLCGGLFRPMLTKKVSLLRLSLALLPAVTLGSILWQSFALDYVYGSGFLALLSSRSLQFTVVFVLDIVIIRLLFAGKVFAQAGLWPPQRMKRSQDHDRQ